MKKLSGQKKIVVLLLVIQLLLSLVVHAETNVEFSDCAILRKAISNSNFKETVQLKTYNTNGEETILNCEKSVLINGRRYKNAQDIYDAIEENSFAKIGVQNGVITVLNFDSSYENYENVEYKEKKGRFNTLNSKQSNLPVYYMYNGDFVPAHTDENHYYDLEVYDYAICITDMKSKTENAVIDYIETSSSIDSNFMKSINIYCESEEQDRNVLKGELYDEKGRLLAEKVGEEGEIYFGNLENETKTYEIKLWLEDEEGNEISSEYIKEYKVDKAEIEYAYILRKAISSNNFNETVQLKTYNTNGKEIIYNLAEITRVNGRRYKNVQSIYDAIEENTYAKMAIENGVVTVLNFSGDTEFYENAEYNSETNCFMADGTELGSLPVYYRYNEDLVSAYTDENHYYDIEVSDYAVCINRMKSKTDAAVIEYIDKGSLIGGNYMQSINICCESTAQDGVALKGELYDENGRLLAEETGEEGELYFGNLENETKTYEIKFWLEDEDGNEISSKYITEHQTIKAEIKYVYISRKAVNDAEFDEVVQLKTFDTNGKKTIYNLGEIARVNGRRYKNTQDIYDAIEENTYAKMAIENGVVTVLNCSGNTEFYENAEYNCETNRFIADGIKLGSLPVYYRYNEDLVSAYTDENHYYDIEISDYAICITDIKSKTGAKVIDFIDVSTLVGSDFKQVINVYCELDETENFVLKGRVYDEKTNLVSKAETELSGCGELVFDDIKNKSENCTIKIWLEDESHNKVSEDYVIHRGIMQNKIKYGKVNAKYETEDEEGNVILSVRGIDGTDSVYVYNNDTNIINAPMLFSIESAAYAISENSFVKMAVKDGVVSAVLIEPCNLELYADDFGYDDELSGSVYVLNNSEELQEFACYVAIYNDSDVLKCCDIIPITIESDDYLSVMPEIDGYEYSQGDYLKMFAWENGKLRPLTEYVSADIICR